MHNVLQVTPELNAGGVERTTIELADAISRAGGLALVASAGARLESELKAVGGELVRLPVKSKNPFRVLANSGLLAKLAKARGVNIIHARSRAPAWSALWAARRLKLPFVTTYHGVYNAKSGLKRFYNSVMARGDLVIANSEFTRVHVLDQYALAPERVVAIPRGVDLEIFNPARIDPARIAQLRSSWGLDTNDPRLVVILPARLTRWKGQLVLIEAVARLSARYPRAVKLVFAGDAQGRSNYVNEMMTAISAGGLHDDVAVIGHLQHIAEGLAASDVAVFPSTDPEAFGRGAVEAQAMARPVLASRLGGLAETVLDGETGLLTPPASAAALADAIERLIAMGPEARAAMGEKGRAHVVGRYSKTLMQQATLGVYDRLLGAQP
jgi:glycosyltransferase involved in cell wall biosynthesis